MNQLMTTVFAEQPLDLPGSANYVQYLLYATLINTVAFFGTVPLQFPCKIIGYSVSAKIGEL